MSEPHELLNQAMNERRLTLDMNWNQVASAAGMSAEALRAIRRGDYKPTELTARRLDNALQWEPGTVSAFYPTEQPPAAEPEPSADDVLADFSGIENPTPREAAMLDYLVALRQEVRDIHRKIDAMAADREPSDEDVREQKGA